MEVVNGYPCKNCTDVEYAKKGVDPANPKDGPNGADKADSARETGKADKAQRSDGAQQAQDNKPVDYGPAVKFDGALSGAAQAEQTRQQPSYIPGTVADIKA